MQNLQHLQRVRYVTENYRELQGLRITPLERRA